MEFLRKYMDDPRVDTWELSRGLDESVEIWFDAQERGVIVAHLFNSPKYTVIILDEDRNVLSTHHLINEPEVIEMVDQARIRPSEKIPRTG